MAYGSVNVPGVSAPDLKTHTDDKANPHDVTKAQVGLGNVDNTSDADKPISNATQTALNGKANASHTHAAIDVTQDSSHRFVTDSEKSTWNGKANASHGTHVSYSSTAPKMDGTASVGSASTVARSDHVHPTDTSRAAASHTHSNYMTTSSPTGIGSFSMNRKSGTTVGAYAMVAGYSCEASGTYSHAEGNGTIASGDASHAEGNGTIASGGYSHAEGTNTKAIGGASHAEGTSTKATGNYSHAEGISTIASGKYSHAEGGSEAIGDYSHAEGSGCITREKYSHAEGLGTIAAAQEQHVQGSYNIESTLFTDAVIIGKGMSSTDRSNCFRVTHTGVYASGSYNSSGADYAELFEWLDGNPDNIDRVGLFVTLDGEKIRLANSDDDFILGVISGNPSVVGDVEDDQWRGMYLYDIYGRPLWEDVEVPDRYEEIETVDENGETVTERILIEKAHTEHRQKLNPDYDSAQPYQKRTERKEWGCVGMMGKLVVNDDGSCVVNGWAKPGEGGTATKSETPTKYRVMSRIDDAHIRILIL